MKTLFLDLASHEGCVALVHDSEVIVRPADHRLGDHELLPLIESVLKEGGIEYKDLDRLASTTGPGGFTSLRVAVSTINTLSFSLKIPVAGIHLSEWRKAQCTEENLWWLHSTKKEQLFVRGFGKYSVVLPEPTLFTVEEALSRAEAGMKWTGELIPEQRAKADAVGLVEAERVPLEKVLSGFLEKQIYKNELVVPWYGRGW
jgi:tRNA threonylcarbamoyl adenosine modification protein YeaZ